MDRKQTYLARLSEHLDERGDLAPPWERFPTYERYTLGWRMGTGEDWLVMWWAFLDQLGASFEARLAYLRRHAPAPFSWASTVHSVLHPSSEDEVDEDDEADDEESDKRTAQERRAALLQQGLIASDIAYATWLRQQDGVHWPWTYQDTPEGAARYYTRDLSFWSRQVAGLRGDPAWTPPPVPDPWQSCAAPLATGAAGSLDLERGLRSLARMLAAGHVTPPWQLGLTLTDFADSFEDDMGYVDAFRLWGMSVFDDQPHLRRYLDATQVPASWEPWIADHWPVD
jgi:hypothetical protein